MGVLKPSLLLLWLLVVASASEVAQLVESRTLPGFPSQQPGKNSPSGFRSLEIVYFRSVPLIEFRCCSICRLLEDPGDTRSRLQVLRRRRRVYSYMGGVLLQAPMPTMETRLKRIPLFSYLYLYMVWIHPFVELDQPLV